MNIILSHSKIPKYIVPAANPSNLFWVHGLELDIKLDVVELDMELDLELNIAFNKEIYI